MTVTATEKLAPDIEFKSVSHLKLVPQVKYSDLDLESDWSFSFESYMLRCICNLEIQLKNI